ncbi:MAG: hypothetical protein JWQ25_1341, partial [Daejeonella sp.]|nr:hypothetical protein [Daejeonella sp.]
MQGTLKTIKNNWLTLTKFGIFLSSAIAIIVSAPPIADFNNNTVRFLITLITAFLLIPIFLYKKRNHFKYWLISSLITCFVAVALLASYYWFVSKYVINYPPNRKIVIGTKFQDSVAKQIAAENNLEDHKNYLDSSEEHNFYLLSIAGGKAENIWDHNGIDSNKIT